MTDDASITAEILRQTGDLGPKKSITPEEVARALAPDEATWRPLMHRVRIAALALQATGQIEILRKGKPVPREEVRGVIRLRTCGGG
ncbi:DUF3253 domain-containing protein [Humitalea sp. 24SJ18S-53]|uniref:DUF3253 domain-containing protein n=1 Tax=Humitalea sp. 24SJ18S-53 TaxID=3422307 RepID=UPI003D670195